MIHLDKTQAIDDIYLSALELSSSTSTHLLFTFKNVFNKRVISIAIDKLSDSSTNKNRYSLFKMPTFVLFFNEQVGRWHYTVRDQNSAINLDEQLAGEVIESGTMYLHDNVKFYYKKYSQQQFFIGYDGR